MEIIELITDCSDIVTAAIEISTKVKEDEIYLRKIIRTILLSKEIGNTNKALMFDELFKRYSLKEIAAIIEKKIIYDNISPENILEALRIEKIITLEV